MGDNREQRSWKCPSDAGSGEPSPGGQVSASMGEELFAEGKNIDSLRVCGVPLSLPCFDSVIF